MVESVKAASDVYAPVGGTVTEGNQALVDDPALVNTDPEGEGWFFKLDSQRQSRARRADERRRSTRPIATSRVTHGQHRLPLVAGRLCAATPPSCRRSATRCCSCSTPQPGELILDLGCGDGVLTAADRRGRREGDRPRQLAGDGRGGAGARASTPSSPTPRRMDLRAVRPVRRGLLQRGPALDARSRRGRDAASSRRCRPAAASSARWAARAISRPCAPACATS